MPTPFIQELYDCEFNAEEWITQSLATKFFLGDHEKITKEQILEKLKNEIQRTKDCYKEEIEKTTHNMERLNSLNEQQWILEMEESNTKTTERINKKNQEAEKIKEGQIKTEGVLEKVLENHNITTTTKEIISLGLDLIHKAESDKKKSQIELYTDINKFKQEKLNEANYIVAFYKLRAVETKMQAEKDLKEFQQFLKDIEKHLSNKTISNSKK